MKCGGLICTNPEINKWFAGSAKKQHADGSVRVTCAVEDGVGDRPLGFYALATVAEEISNLPGVYHPFRGGEHFSALQLVWLATDKGYVDRGLGSLMVGEVIRLFARVGPEIGLPHLIVVPAEQDYERLVGFYDGLGFKPYKDGEAMFLTLPEAIDAVNKTEAILRQLREANELAS